MLSLKGIFPCPSTFEVDTPPTTVVPVTVVNVAAPAGVIPQLVPVIVLPLKRTLSPVVFPKYIFVA